VFGSVDFSNFGRESILKNDALCDARDGILNTPRIARPAWFSFRAWREVCAETQACGNRHVELKPMASACAHADINDGVQPRPARSEATSRTSAGTTG
jgi:hypothetical protein